MTGLKESVLRIFVEKLKESEKDNLLRVVLFGSVARGTETALSDIDVFILLKEGRRFDLTNRIVDISTDVDLDYGDCKTRIAPFISNETEYLRDSRIIPVFEEISREGVVLYDAT